MCRREKPVEALQYLQGQVAQVVGPQDAEAFQRLSRLLFTNRDAGPSSGGAKELCEERGKLYEELAGHFSRGRRPPGAKLADLI